MWQMKLLIELSEVVLSLNARYLTFWIHVPQAIMGNAPFIHSCELAARD